MTTQTLFKPQISTQVSCIKLSMSDIFDNVNFMQTFVHTYASLNWNTILCIMKFDSRTKFVGPWRQQFWFWSSISGPNQLTGQLYYHYICRVMHNCAISGELYKDRAYVFYCYTRWKSKLKGKCQIWQINSPNLNGIVCLKTFLFYLELLANGYATVTCVLFIVFQY